MLLDLSLRWGARPVIPGRDVPPREPDEIPAAADTPAAAVDGRPAALPADPLAARTFVEGLFARHRGEIYAYLVRMIRDPELAADMTQDAFIRAYRAYADLDDQAKARAWLYQIAHRVALDEIRRRRIIRFVPWAGESRGSSPSAEHVVLEGAALRGPGASAAADPGTPAFGAPPCRGPRPERRWSSRPPWAPRTWPRARS